jgi:hypothetical protein
MCSINNITRRTQSDGNLLIVLRSQEIHGHRTVK